MMVEEWKEITGFEGIYSISSFGRARSDRGGSGTTRGLILKPRYTKDGYVKYMLRRDGSSKAFLAHRLVYAAFIGDVLPSMQIDHLDGIKDNNGASNLEQTTRLENMRRSFASGRNMAVGERSGTSKITQEIVVQIRAMKLAGRKQIDIAGEFGLTKHHVSQICRRISWRHVD